MKTWITIMDDKDIELSTQLLGDMRFEWVDNVSELIEPYVNSKLSLVSDTQWLLTLEIGPDLQECLFWLLKRDNQLCLTHNDSLIVIDEFKHWSDYFIWPTFE